MTVPQPKARLAIFSNERGNALNEFRTELVGSKANAAARASGSALEAAVGNNQTIGRSSERRFWLATRQQRFLLFRTVDKNQRGRNNGCRNLIQVAP